MRYAYLFLFCLVSFFVLKLWAHGSLLIFDFEEYIKLDFINKANSFTYFFPGNHSGDAFFGHPGINNYMYFLFSKVFEPTLYTARVFSLLMSTLCVGSLFLLVKEVSSYKVAFFTSISFLILPMFQIQSIMFLNELGSFFWVFLSLYFYLKARYLLFALCGIFAVLYLESAVSYYLCIFSIAVYESIRQRKIEKIKIFTSMAPVLAMVLFFIFEKIYTGNFSNHITQNLIKDRLAAPVNWLTDLYYSELALRRYITFVENVPMTFVITVLLIGLLHLVNYKKWTISPGLKILLYPLILQMLFFNFLSTYEGGRDFYAGFAFLFFYFFYYVSKIKFGTAISAITLAILAGKSYSRLTLDKDSWYQTTFKEYTHGEEYGRTAENIEDVYDGSPCLKVKGRSGLFCDSFFGLVDEDIKSVGKSVAKSKGRFFVIITPDLRHNLIAEYKSHGFYVLQDRHVGSLRDKDLFMLTFTHSNN